MIKKKLKKLLKRNGRLYINVLALKSRLGGKMGLVSAREQREFRRNFKAALGWKPKVVVEMAESFYRAEMRLAKEAFSRDELGDDEVVLICLVKDTVGMVEIFLEHYRAMGIKRFVFIDDGSSDGTLEALVRQGDCTVFATEEGYGSGVPSLGWISRVMAYYGHGRWYLTLDIDELLVFEEVERIGIEGLMKCVRARGVTAVRAVMIDMYADKPLLAVDEGVYEDGKFLKTFRYMDGDTYRLEESDTIPMMTGGPRQRVFGEYGARPNLSKYPLVFFGEGMLRVSNHGYFPMSRNYEGGADVVRAALLHFKFLPGDLEKYKKHIRDGIHYNGSAEYKAYVKKLAGEPDLSMYYSGSVGYKDSKSLKKVAVIESITK